MQLVAGDDGAILARRGFSTENGFVVGDVFGGIFYDREDSMNIFRSVSFEGMYRLFSCINQMDRVQRLDPWLQDHYDYEDGSNQTRRRAIPDSWRICPED